MLTQFYTAVRSIQTAPFWVQSLTVITFLNLIIFIIKSLIFGLKIYYIVQLFISISILLILKLVILPYYLANNKFKQSILQANFYHQFYFQIFNLKFACYKTAKSRWTWLFTFWSFLHMVYVSCLAVVTWDCTMYIRVSFAVCFIFFLCGILALKLQTRSTPWIFELETPESSALDFNKNLFVLIRFYNKFKLGRTFLFAYTQQHTFHILLSSLWPVYTAYLAFDTLFFIVRYLSYGTVCYTNHHITTSLQLLIVGLTIWFWNITQEANEGNHTKKVRFNLTHGFILFIASEIMLFFSIFWTFYHSSFSPTVSIYCMWPPLGIEPINAWGLPFFNTILLVSSGISLTVSHRTVYYQKVTETAKGLLLTLILGFSFTLVQLFEYVKATFSINDSVFGSIFFFSTGFHGVHVLLGSIMLFVSLLRNAMKQLFSSQHIGFTTSIWYWHFVDVVWIFLFLMVYWWGS